MKKIKTNACSFYLFQNKIILQCSYVICYQIYILKREVNVKMKYLDIFVLDVSLPIFSGFPCRKITCSFIDLKQHLKLLFRNHFHTHDTQI